MNLQRARTIVAAALTHRAAAGLKPLCVAVLDAGGVLVVEDGRIIGAVGVSGDTSDNDEAAAIAGAQAAGLTAQ